MPTIQTSLAPHASSILAIAAHPDDIESWCAGTLAQSIDAGSTEAWTSDGRSQTSPKSCSKNRSSEDWIYSRY